RCSAEVCVEPSNAAVPDSVAQGLLQNSEEAQRDGRRDLVRYVLVGELNLDVLLRRQLGAEASHRGDDAEQLQPRRMQLVGECLQVARDLRGLRLQLLKALAQLP